ncbi:MAG: hypothetical protein ACRBBP_11235 [Bdellovibrionales bacterium]
MERRKTLGLPDKMAVFADAETMVTSMVKTQTKDIIITDDASFSGMQLADSLYNLNRAAKLWDLSGLNIHLIIPYVTEATLSRLKEFQADTKQGSTSTWTPPQVHLYSQERIPSFHQTVLTARQNKSLSEETALKIQELFSYEPRQTLTYFDHKIPDFVSSVSTQAGSSTNHIVETFTLTNTRGQVEQFNLVKSQPSPYKEPITRTEY